MADILQKIRKLVLKCRVQNTSHFASTTMCLHIGAETIWPPFPDDSFRLIFKYENEYSN